MRPFSVSAFGAALSLACANGFHVPVIDLGGEDLQPRQEQAAPQTAVAPSGERYVVRYGDTLTDIARRRGLDVETLARANALADPDRLEVGQELVVPPGAKLAPPRRSRSPRPAARAAAAPAPVPASAALLPVDCAILDSDESLRSARFEQAIDQANEARRLLRALEPQPGIAERRARVEVLLGMAEVALGRDPEARASFARALEADPLLTLAPGEVSPKILRIFEDARARPAQQASR
jgi:LysM repeat protein